MEYKIPFIHIVARCLGRQNIRECFKAKHDLVQKIFKDAANKDAVDDTEFLYQVYLFTHQLDDWRLGGEAKTLPEIYKGFISKKTGKQVTIPKNAKDGIKPANDAAAPTKTQRDNLKIAYNYVRTRVGTNLEKILKTADACTNKVAYIWSVCAYRSHFIYAPIHAGFAYHRMHRICFAS